MSARGLSVTRSRGASIMNPCRPKAKSRPLHPDVIRWQVMYSAATRCRCGASALRMLAVHAAPGRLAGVAGARQRSVSSPSYVELQREGRLPHGSIVHARRELVAAGLIQRAPGHQCGGDDPVALYTISPRVKDAEAAARVSTPDQRCISSRSKNASVGVAERAPAGALSADRAQAWLVSADLSVVR